MTQNYEKMFADNERLYKEVFKIYPNEEQNCTKAEVKAILSNDWEGTKIGNYRKSPTITRYRRQIELQK